MSLPQKARHPDEILGELDAVQIILDNAYQAMRIGLEAPKLRDLMWEVINDILHSIELAETAAASTGPYVNEIHNTVLDYVTNHYGDD